MIAAPIEPPSLAKAQETGSLLAAARPIRGDRWENGVAWRPERCFTALGYGPCDEDPALPPDDLFDDGPVHAYPLAYRVRDFCTTLSQRALDVQRLVRQAEATASFQLARELWTGALTAASPVQVDAAPYQNPSLIGSPATVVVTATGTVADKLGALEAAAMADANGQQVFLHVPPRFLFALGNLITKSGDLLLTPLGNVIVADAGYPGSGPSAPAATSWAFATGPVAARLSPIEELAVMAETLDRRTNRQEIWADRLFVVTFDPCTKYAIDLAA